MSPGSLAQQSACLVSRRSRVQIPLGAFNLQSTLSGTQALVGIFLITTIVTPIAFFIRGKRRKT